MAMVITIEIDDEENMSDCMAVGAKDMAEVFLGKAKITPRKVTIMHIDSYNKILMAQGKEYNYWTDTWMRPGLNESIGDIKGVKKKDNKDG